MAFFSKSLRNGTKKHDFIEGLTEWTSTEHAELTEFITEYSPTDFTLSGNTQIVRVRIIKTTKYAHVKDSEVADNIAVEHNVLATFFPILFHRRRTESDRTADGIRSDGGRNLIRRRTETDRTANANGGTLRGCTCLRSALPLARARSAPTEQEMHQQSKSCTLCECVKTTMN